MFEINANVLDKMPMLVSYFIYATIITVCIYFIAKYITKLYRLVTVKITLFKNRKNKIVKANKGW